MDLTKNLLQAHEIFEKANNIIITTHTNPDADALGSALSLYLYGIEHKKSIKVINNSATPDNLKFLPKADDILIYNESLDDEILNADVIFVLDLNDSSRLKSMENAVLNSKATKIMIDHHIDPESFCDFYCSDIEASSTGELMYKFFDCDPNFKLNSEIATNLYAAIMTDTGSFRFPRTTPYVHQIIAKMIDYGADPFNIYDKIYNCNSFNATKLLGKALSSMELFFGGKVCIMSIPRNYIFETYSKDDDIDNFVEKTLLIEGVVCGILMAEITNKDEIRLSIRSKGDFSARDIAVKFNGGGHFNAAGARIFNSDINSAKKLVLNEIKEIYPELV